jgi:hypothetical protein
MSSNIFRLSVIPVDLNQVFADIQVIVPDALAYIFNIERDEYILESVEQPNQEQIENVQLFLNSL